MFVFNHFLVFVNFVKEMFVFNHFLVFVNFVKEMCVFVLCSLQLNFINYFKIKFISYKNKKTKYKIHFIGFICWRT